MIGRADAVTGAVADAASVGASAADAGSVGHNGRRIRQTVIHTFRNGEESLKCCDDDWLRS